MKGKFHLISSRIVVLHSAGFAGISTKNSSATKCFVCEPRFQSRLSLFRLLLLSFLYHVAYSGTPNCYVKKSRRIFEGTFLYWLGWKWNFVLWSLSVFDTVITISSELCMILTSDTQMNYWYPWHFFLKKLWLIMDFWNKWKLALDFFVYFFSRLS